MDIDVREKHKHDGCTNHKKNELHALLSIFAHRAYCVGIRKATRQIILELPLLYNKKMAKVRKNPHFEPLSLGGLCIEDIQNVLRISHKCLSSIRSQLLGGAKTPEGADAEHTRCLSGLHIRVGIPQVEEPLRRYVHLFGHLKGRRRIGLDRDGGQRSPDDLKRDIRQQSGGGQFCEIIMFVG